jgi:hypothetical protein
MTKVLVLYVGDPDKPEDQRAVATLTAARIVLVSNYADLRDEHDNMVATLTWKGNVKVREI